MERSFVSMADYKDASGRIDYDRYRAAQIANGEHCQQCETLISVFGIGKPRDCHQCQDLAAKPQQSVEHDKLIRCPSCRALFEGPQSGIDYNRGYIDAYCESCECEFEVDIEVSVSFRSPKVCEHDWEEIGGAADEDCTEKFERCKRCKTERSTETPRA